jgi:hypothetical protein
LKDRPVFLTSGAAWIREWIADHYPRSRSILDFFHLMEHLYQFADHAFPDAPSDRAQWCEWQKELLTASQVETVIDSIDFTRAGEKDKKYLIAYYQNNKNEWDMRNTGQSAVALPDRVQ